jgi:hypothetical protein
MISPDYSAAAINWQVRQRKITHKGAEEDVNKADEGLCKNHSLPEIPRVAHFSHECDEQEGTTVAVY